MERLPGSRIAAWKARVREVAASHAICVPSHPGPRQFCGAAAGQCAGSGLLVATMVRRQHSNIRQLRSKKGAPLLRIKHHNLEAALNAEPKAELGPG